MNFILIVLSIIIIFLLFLIYRSLMASSPALVTNISLKSGNTDIALSKLKIKDYSTYNIEFWIFVNTNTSDISFSSMNNNNYNGKFGKTNNSKGCILQTNNTHLSLDLYSDNVFTFYNGRNDAASPAKAYPSVMTNNFPIQKWTCVVVSVQNNSLVDLYINGKLVQSANYNSSDSINKIIKPLSTESLQFGNKLDAYITKLRINSVAMTTTTAWNNYLKGNGSVSKMNLSFNLTQDGKISNKINIL